MNSSTSMRSRKGGRLSIVPTMAQVVIDTSNPAPRSNTPSLDFDRVVNAYSVMSVKKRLVNHHNNYNASGSRLGSTQRKRRPSQQMKQMVRSYRTFQSQKQEKEHENLLHSPNGKRYAQWALTIALGIICGSVGVLIVFYTSHIIGFRTQRLNWQLQWASGTGDDAAFESYYQYTAFWDKLAHRFGIRIASEYGSHAILLEYMIYNAVLASASALLCIFFAPNAVGSGIPEVKAYLNGVCVESFADIPVFLTKIVGTICSVSSGLIVGPEGPLVHIGAIVGQGITKTTPLEMAVRRLQTERPTIARLAGCGNADEGGYATGRKEEERCDEVLRLQSTKEGEDEDEEEEEDDGGCNVSTEEEGLLSLRLGDLEDIANDESYKSTEAYRRQRDTARASSTDSVLEDEIKGCCPDTNRTFLSQSMAVLSRFRNDGDRRDLISIGVATGFAAAFGAPVGGLLYSFEEASSFFTIPLMWRTLVATAIGTFVIALYHGDMSQFSVLSLGDGSQMEKRHFIMSFAELPFYVLIGAAGGLLGAFFNGCYLSINTVRARFYAHPDRNESFFRFLEVLIVSILTSLVTFCFSVYIPQSWACSNMKNGAGEDGADEAFGERYNCPVGQFNEIASILLGSRDEALNDILTDPSKFEPRTLLLTGLCFLFLMIITFGIFIPSGLFMPTLLTGSTLSGWAGLMLQRHVWSSIVPEHFALVGATAMLAGVQRTTVSLCVIMMEATGQTKVLIPLIIGVVVARYVADFFNDGFYHINMHMKHYPYLEHEIRETFDICTVSDVMTSPVVTLNGVEEAGDIEQLLRQHKNKAFPVLDQDTEQYIGLIRRDQLVALLECGIYLESLDEHQSHRESVRVKELLTRAQSEHINRALMSDADTYSAGRTSGKKGRQSEWFTDNVVRSDHGRSVVISTDETLPGGNSVSRPRGTIVDTDEAGNIIVRVDPEEKYCNVDVSAAMNRGAYTVMQNCPLSKAYTLFTGMGLRHLPVLGRDGAIVGILTRSNLDAKYMEKRTGLDMHH